jgi:hypothetical protein
MMISHTSHGCSFSGKNQRSFNTSKISKPLLRNSKERKSNSFKQIMGESMSTMRYIIFFMRNGFKCNTRFPILCNKTKLLSGKIDLYKRWHLTCYMKSRFHRYYGLKNLIVQLTSKHISPYICQG